MIQTHYVRLEPPYEVIFCNGEVGIQIGSLIAVEEKRGENDEYGLVTHTHPIVSYGSKRTLSFWTRGQTNVWTSPGDYVQGAVWDKVEVNDVLVLGVLDEEKSWYLSEKGFAELVYRMLEAKIQQGQSTMNAIYYLERNLRLIGIAPSFGKHTEMKLEVEIEDYYDVPFITISSDDECIQLAVPFMGVEEMADQTFELLRPYLYKFYKYDVANINWTFEIESVDIESMTFDDGTPLNENYIAVANLVKRLNKIFSKNK